jgi:hypothetical protein
VAAHGTGWQLIDGHKQAELLIDPFNTLQKQNAWVWQDCLRMARGRCHCPESVKHFCFVLFRYLHVAPKARKSPELAQFGGLFWPTL